MWGTEVLGCKLAGGSPLRDPEATLAKVEVNSASDILMHMKSQRDHRNGKSWSNLGSTIRAEIKQERLHKSRNCRMIKSVCPSNYFYFDPIYSPSYCEVFIGLDNAKLKDYGIG